MRLTAEAKAKEEKAIADAMKAREDAEKAEREALLDAERAENAKLKATIARIEAENLANSKILIVEHCGHKYGLVVDALENIVSIDTTEKLRMPLLVTNQLNTHLQKDLLEFIELPDNTTAMLMDSRPLMVRLTHTEILQGDTVN